MSRTQRTRDKNGETGIISFRRKDISAGSDQNATGGSAGIEIAGFPQKSYTRTFGNPDTLFVPLLEAARDAKQNAGPAHWPWREAWKRSDVERDSKMMSRRTCCAVESETVTPVNEA